MDEYATILERLKKGKRFLIASHGNPDGDGIGSTIVLGLALERLGKEVVLYNGDPVPAGLAFLPAVDRLVQTLDSKRTFDVTIMVDCAQRRRISDEFAAFPGLGEVICIDHHILDKAESDLSLIDCEAASTGEVVLKLIKQLGVEVDAAIAQCIYTTLVVDTGFFRYSNTTENVLALAAELVGVGASPWEVAKSLEESYPASRMKLLGFVLESLATQLEGRYASMDVTQEMLARANATLDQSDEFATYPRSIGGVEVAALFRENADGSVKLSLRSKDHVDVAAIAKGFGGGGHARAAGFTINGTLAEAKKKVLEAITSALKQSEV